MITNSRGFSIVELLIAIAIIMIGVTAIVPLFVFISQASESNRLRAVATNLANEILEDIRSSNFNEVGVIGGDPEGPFLQSEVRSIDGKNYTAQIFINWLDEGSGCLSNEPDNGSWDYKGVRVSVTAMSVFSGENMVSATAETIIARDASQPAQAGANIRACIFRGWRPDVDLYEPVSSVRVDLTLESGVTSSVWSTSEGSALFVNRPVGNHTVSINPSSLGMIVEPETSPYNVVATAASTSKKLVFVEYPCSIRVQFVDENGAAVTGSGRLIVETPFKDSDDQVINIISDFSAGQESVLVTGIWPVGAGYAGAYNIKVINVAGYKDYDMSVAVTKPLLPNGDDWDGKFAAPGTEIVLTVTLLTEREAAPFKDNLLLNLDAAAINGLEDGSFIEKWDDWSGSDNHALQINASSRPVYKTNVLDGKPVVRFDGSHFLVVANPEQFNVGYFTLFIVTTPASLSGERPLISRLVNAIGTRYWRVMFRDNDLEFYTHSGIGGYNSDWNLLSTGYVFSSTSTELIAVRFNGSNKILNLNGDLNNEQLWDLALRAEGDTAVEIASHNNGSHFYRGDIAEILFYNRALSDSEMIVVERYLGEKWLGWID